MPTISLCMIVKDEQEVLHRCLSSIAALVDEIIIVDTGSVDDTVAIAGSFTDKIYHLTWQHDFAAARNFSFSKATADYILWLDADDVIEPASLHALMELKPGLSADVYLLGYDYSQDEYGNSTCTLTRERIVRNNGIFRWKYPVHEVIDNIHAHFVQQVEITVKHVRTVMGVAADQGRNLRILEHAMQQSQYFSDCRIWFYYGRELQDHQQFEQAIKVFGRCLLFEEQWHEERMITLFRLAQCHWQLRAVDEAHLGLSTRYAQQAIAFDSRWAEPYFMLGEIAYHQNNYEAAASWFKQCLREIPPVLNAVSRALYEVMPALYLVFCYDRLQDYHQAWYYNEIALGYKKDDKGLLFNRASIGKQLSAKTPVVWYGKNISPMFPAYRIRALRMHHTLQWMGVGNDMTDDAGELYMYEVVIFFKYFTEEEFEVMSRMKALGKKVVLDVSENLLPHANERPWYLPMVMLADTVICCSAVLADLLRPYNAVVVVIEDATEPVTHRSELRIDKPMRAGWIGMPENAVHVEALRPLLLANGCELIAIHNGPGHDRYWTIESWQYHLAGCDFVIAPQDISRQPAKSNNKVTTAMAMGLPVIASPLDAYASVIVHNYNGFLASSPEEWREAVLKLQSAALRASFRDAGYRAAMRFRQENIALKWWRVLLDNYNDTAVDIIIPTINDTSHLHHCIASVIACTQVPYHIIVVNSGSHELQLDPDIRVIKTDALNYAAALNIGIAASKSPYICMMNDDVIVSDGWLPPLIADIRQGAGCSNPLSNCDKGWLHDYDLRCEGISLGPATNVLHDGLICERENISRGIDPSAIWNWQPGIKQRIFQREWVPFFCTLTSREVINKTGVLDDAFHNGCEDVDYCTRVQKQGYHCVVNEHSFVFHFGGTSTAALAEANPERNKATQHYLKEKYQLPLLCIHAGYAFESWNAATIRHTGMGGSETAVAAMAEEFKARGYRVVVCCECEGNEGMVDGVKYLPLEGFRDFIDRHYIDVMVISRVAATLNFPIRAGKTYFWLHDIYAVASAEEHVLITQNAAQLDGIFCLSPWHMQFAANFYQLPADKFILTGNGIDLERFTSVVEKKTNRFIYSSSPDRSLDVVLRLFPKVRHLIPDATLHIYYGFENWERNAYLHNDLAAKEKISEIKQLMQQEGVYYHGRVDQRRLAKAFQESDVWLYPTTFTETYCITALEAQAARTLCVCTNLAGLKSTVGDRGILLDVLPDDPAFETVLLTEIMAIQQDTSRKNCLLDHGQQWASQQSWWHIAEQWQQLFEGRSAEVDYVGRQINALQC
ncbi:glycosyltransferase [Chitinophaga sp. sic0106]|uniref:glycosyltransferase n=1 Tax=Chitinophaga sp. sic0106 TaxID=2854785 RepID=UPI001C48457F|nr:glycosyltransferase [Chitinophaga sp. sic0106]MBV7529889.1 glycosyltransferase [Chitinophaga sp. sic0106]